MPPRVAHTHPSPAAAAILPAPSRSLLAPAPRRRQRRAEATPPSATRGSPPRAPPPRKLQPSPSAPSRPRCLRRDGGAELRDGSGRRGRPHRQNDTVQCVAPSLCFFSSRVLKQLYWSACLHAACCLRERCSPLCSRAPALRVPSPSVSDLTLLFLSSCRHSLLSPLPKRQTGPRSRAGNGTRCAGMCGPGTGPWGAQHGHQLLPAPFIGHSHHNNDPQKCIFIHAGRYLAAHQVLSAVLPLSPTADSTYLPKPRCSVITEICYVSVISTVSDFTQKR